MRRKNDEESNFKNIELRSNPIKSPSPDSQTSYILQPTSSPTNRSGNYSEQIQNFHK